MSHNRRDTSKTDINLLNEPQHTQRDFDHYIHLHLCCKLNAFVERSHDAVLSRVLWEWRHGKLYRSCTPIWPPRSRGETNYIVTNPFLWSAESLFCKVRVFELWTFTIKNPFFFTVNSSRNRYNSPAVNFYIRFKDHWFFPSGSIEVSHHKITMNPRVEKKSLEKNDFKAIYHFRVIAISHQQK